MTAKLGMAIERAVRASREKTQLSEGLDCKKVALIDDKEGKEQLGKSLSMIFNGLKTYGKEPASLEDTAKLFNFVLSDYSWQEISQALRFYIKHNSDFPAPADIASIIDRSGKPPFSKIYYVALQKKAPEIRTSEEWEYLREFESFLLHGK